MKDNHFVYVEVPYNKEIAYTLYASGLTIDVPKLAEDNSTVTFKYPKKTVFVLFYEFNTPHRLKTRRAYVLTCQKDKNSKEEVALPGVSDKVQIIYQARGHKVDSLKRCLHILSQNEKYLIYKMPVLFWYKICAMIEYYDGKRMDFVRLYNLYRPKNYKELSIYDN